MKNLLPLALMGILVLGPVVSAQGQDLPPSPVSVGSAAGSTGPGANPTGKVLVLDNERTLEGDVEQIGEQFRVRYPVGETWWPADRVLKLCASYEEAYRFLRGRANLDDPDEHMRLAQWCRDRGLRNQALVEVKAAVDLRPDHAESKRLLAHLQQAAQARPPAPAPAHPESDPLPSLPVAVTAEAVGQFATRVQPILMNSCAGCHAGGRGGPFKLTRAYDYGSSRRSTHQNLAAVLNEVNLIQPLASPFLTKALSVHGKMAQAPFRNRESPAYRALEEWVRQTAPGSLPDAGPDELRTPKPELWGPRPEARNPETTRPPVDATTPVPVPPVAREEFASQGRDHGTANPTPGPPKPAGPVDPWDPENFNGDTHPPQGKDK